MPLWIREIILKYSFHTYPYYGIYSKEFTYYLPVLLACDSFFNTALDVFFCIDNLLGIFTPSEVKQSHPVHSYNRLVWNRAAEHSWHQCKLPYSLDIKANHPFPSWF